MAGHDEADLAEMFTEAYWDERYRTRDALWSGRPNATLVAEVSGLSPGQALDAGCGEGADSIWLAGQGWQVTGVDISAVALDRAAGHAAAAGPDIAGRITWQRVDLLDWDPGRDSCDLATAHFMHFPPGLRDDAFRSLAAAVRPGGTLLIVGHHPADHEHGQRHDHRRELMFTAQDAAASLDPAEWEISVTSPSREATDPDGNVRAVVDAVLRAVRRS